MQALAAIKTSTQFYYRDINKKKKKRTTTTKKTKTKRANGLNRNEINKQSGNFACASPRLVMLINTEK